jgi:3-deoxy-D-manno-octulosonate 8-phosphate phosphatase (KDO 8-P phosphatase)
MPDHLREQLRRIKMLAMDVDGVLASPQIVIGSSESGLFEIKQFCVHDGAATWAGRAGGLIQVVLSGRDSPALRQRLDRMKVDAAYLGEVNKLGPLALIKEEYDVTDAEIAYIGDDFLDIPIMERVGMPIAVADATPEMLKRASYVTKKKGGEGAVEETVRLILQAQDKWEAAVQEAVAHAYATPDMLGAGARY